VAKTEEHEVKEQLKSEDEAQKQIKTRDDQLKT
jgi:hypothetical protein